MSFLSRTVAVLRRAMAYNIDLPLPPGQYCSRFDLTCGETALAAVEQLFTSGKVRPIRDAFVAFLDDPEAERSLKKGVHEVYERALRAVALRHAPPEREGFDPVETPRTPYESAAIEDLAVLLPGTAPLPSAPPGGPSPAGLLIPVVGWALALLGKAVTVLLLHGRAAVTPLRFRLASQDFWTEGRWRLVLDALGWEFPAAADFVIVRERGESGHLAEQGFTVFNPATAPVPWRSWLAEAVAPAVVLAARVVWAAARHPTDPRILLVAVECLHQAYLSLDLRRTAYNLRFDLCLDIVEYNAIHNLKGIIYRKVGGGVARLPYSDVDAFGASTAYLGYDLYLASGHYARRNFAGSWRSEMRFVVVGQMYSDRRRRDIALVAPDIRAAIQAQLAAGRRVAAYFGGSKVAGLDRVERDILAVLWAEIEPRDDCFLVIKPKLSNALYDLMAADERLRPMLNSPKVLTLRYGPLKEEVCPAVWLVEHIILGTTMPGSIQTESLMRGRAVLSYYPVPETNRPLPRALAEASIRHSDLAAFAKAVGETLDGHPPVIPVEFLADSFGPFGDDAVLDRMAAALLSSRPYNGKG